MTDLKPKTNADLMARRAAALVGERELPLDPASASNFAALDIGLKNIAA